MNGKKFAARNISRLASFDFGQLRIIGLDDKYETAINAFEVYRRQALDEVATLEAAGDTVVDRLYRIRNSLAHGKVDVLLPDDGEPFDAALRALPIVKLLARMAIDG
jgi:hypothetical protein